MPTEIRPENPFKGDEAYDPRNLTLDNVIKRKDHISITSWRVFLEATLEVARVARLPTQTGLSRISAARTLPL
jgi:hypothetical protein